MKGFLAKITAWLQSVKGVLTGFGALGVFGIALLDAALIPIPGGPDAVVMTLSHLNHSRMLLYVLAAVLGSTLGCLVPYWIGRASGEAALRKFSQEKRERAARLIERYDVWSMIVGAILPPPFPFKVFLISAGVFRMGLTRFLLALSIGRTVRFIAEGLAAIYFGEQVIAFFLQPRPGLVLAVIAIIASVFAVLAFFRRKNRSSEKEIKVEDGDLRTAG
jgi:membrane protein YqaA with SNARE-associated domain